MNDQTFAYSLMLMFLTLTRTILKKIMATITLQNIPSHLFFLDLYSFFVFNEGVIFIEALLFIIVLIGVMKNQI